jgi:succinate dehydrogenase/fumarate reductase flavoprotein subunit
LTRGVTERLLEESESSSSKHSLSPSSPSSPSIVDCAHLGGEEEDEEAKELLAELREVMWEGVGVLRTKAGLEHARSAIEVIRERAEELYGKRKSMETIMLRDAVTAGGGVQEAAARNHTR